MDKVLACEEILFKNSDLNLNCISQGIETLYSRQIDFGDIFFERLTSESFSLEEGLIKGGSFDISQGVGVRAVAGAKTGFAYSDVLDVESLQEACLAARSISHGISCPRACVTPKAFRGKELYPPSSPIDSLSREEKTGILEYIDKKARSADPRIVQVMAGLSCLHRVILIMDTDGRLSCDIKPLVSLSVNVIMKQQSRRESGFAAAGGAIMLDELLQGHKADKLIDDAVRTASLNLEAIPAPSGPMSVVLGAGWPGVLIHEAVGHGLEGDFNRTGSSAFTGLIGQKVASEACTIVDNGSMPGRRGSLSIDDEGYPGARNVLIENGILKGYMQDRQNAMLMQMPMTGNGRRADYSCLPLPRMTNTYMLNGKYTLEEILSSIKKGIYAVNFRGGQVDITSGKFVFSTSEAYLIENGKATTPIKGATLIGNGPEIMKQVSMVGNDLKLDDGVGVCGKSSQSVPVGIGEPTVKVDTLTVGGTDSSAQLCE